MGLRKSCKREDLEPTSQVSFLFYFILFYFVIFPKALNCRTLDTSYGTLFGAALMVQVLSLKNTRP